MFLWKVHLCIIPTNAFLLARGIALENKGTCTFCKVSMETNDHLFFNCYIAQQLWLGIFTWWSVTPMHHGFLQLPALWKMSTIFPSKSLKSAWRITVSATLWALWLTRNQCVFEPSKADTKSLLFLAKSHATEWCQIQDLLHDNSVNWWRDNPVSAIAEAEELKFKELFSCGTSLVGFTDGSWNKKSNCLKAGIGGLIFKNSGEAIFSFFGPTVADNSFEAEWDALDYLGNAFVNSEWKDLQLTIFTDSRKACGKFLELSISSQKGESAKKKDFLMFRNIRVKFIPSELNFRADRLAKKGAKSIKLEHFWVHKRALA